MKAKRLIKTMLLGLLPLCGVARGLAVPKSGTKLGGTRRRLVFATYP